MIVLSRVLVQSADNALTWAVFNKQNEAVKLLLERGANPNVQEEV